MPEIKRRREVMVGMVHLLPSFGFGPLHPWAGSSRSHDALISEWELLVQPTLKIGRMTEVCWTHVLSSHAGWRFRCLLPFGRLRHRVWPQPESELSVCGCAASFSAFCFCVHSWLHNFHSVAVILQSYQHWSQWQLWDYLWDQSQCSTVRSEQDAIACFSFKWAKSSSAKAPTRRVLAPVNRLR